MAHSSFRPDMRKLSGKQTDTRRFGRETLRGVAGSGHELSSISECGGKHREGLPGSSYLIRTGVWLGFARQLPLSQDKRRVSGEVDL